jgi:hypothetical protein
MIAVLEKIIGTKKKLALPFFSQLKWIKPYQILIDCGLQAAITLVVEPHRHPKTQKYRGLNYPQWRGIQKDPESPLPQKIIKIAPFAPRAPQGCPKLISSESRAIQGLYLSRPKSPKK